MASPFEILVQSSWRFLAASLIAFNLITGCTPNLNEKRKIHVFAASSMQEVMLQAKKLFETQHTDTQVVLNLAGSQVLRLQIEQGAPADLFFSANKEHTETLHESGLLDRQQVLAHNELMIVTPMHNPSKVEKVQDLSKASRIVMGTAQSPIGIYTRIILQKADDAFRINFKQKVMDRVVSQENNVRLIRAKVTLGEADAAFVYRTDAMNTSKVKHISIPPELNVKAAYVMAITQKASKDTRSHAFFDFFTTPTGLALLARHGFVVN